jgi:hypothetical protein
MVSSFVEKCELPGVGQLLMSIRKAPPNPFSPSFHSPTPLLHTHFTHACVMLEAQMFFNFWNIGP